VTVFQSIVLGVVQGLSEFLPISSSAHLRLVPYLLGWKDPGVAVTAAVFHLGTLVAVLVYFWPEWTRLAKAALRLAATRRVETVDQRRVILLVVATIPAAVAGAVLADYADEVFRGLVLVACMLMIFGGTLWAVDRWCARTRSLAEIGVRDALLVGLAQVLSLVPGVSRSGITMSAARGLAFDRESATVFSFLMGMPITAAAVGLEVPAVLHQYGLTAPMVAGAVAAGVSGWIAIAVLLRFLVRHGYGVFAVYRVIAAVGILALVALRG
jgi:undecaprenyl-diphosphatase